MLEMFTIAPPRRFIIPRRGAQVEDAAQVGLDHVTPVGISHAREHAVTGEPCVVDEDRDLARVLDECLRLLGVGHVRLHGAAPDLAATASASSAPEW